jgi:hypothetical protein
MTNRIAETILSQIKTIDPRALWAWGSKEYMRTSTDGIMFKTSGMVKWKGKVQIELNGSDLYDITFMRIRKVKGQLTCITDKKVTDVFVEDLVNTIDMQVG